jgi:hypothetical protein
MSLQVLFLNQCSRELGFELEYSAESIPKEKVQDHPNR